jgi:dihydropteroate synthase
MFDIGKYLQLGPHAIALDRPQVMGILNVTPDSFSDGGKFNVLDAALAHARQMQAEGAAIIDVGGESTRPGADTVSVETELARVIPVIEGLRALNIAISIDTQKPEVMRAAIAAGAHLINDVNALQAEGAITAAAELKVPVVLMHRQGNAQTMQSDPNYLDVVEDVARFLTDRILACQLAGIDKKMILIDPGFGFGKTTAHNFELLANLTRLIELDCPVLAGFSRKRSIGEVIGQLGTSNADERDAGSLAAHLLAAQNGARIIRTHSVKATVDALKVLAATPKPRVNKRSQPKGSSELAALFGEP